MSVGALGLPAWCGTTANQLSPDLAAPKTYGEQLEAAASAAPEGAARLSALIDLILWYADAEPARAWPLSVTAMALAEHIDDPLLTARVEYADAVARLFGEKELPAPYRRLRALSERFGSLGSDVDTAWCDHMAAVALEYLGDPAGSVLLLERALTSFRRAGDVAGEARCLNTVGVGEGYVGRRAEALVSFRRATDMADLAGAVATGVLARMNAASAAVELGQRAMAGERFDESYPLLAQADAELSALAKGLPELGFRVLAPRVAAVRAVTLLYLGRRSEALMLADEALRLGELAASDEAVAGTSVHAAEVYLALARPGRARDLFGAALATYEQWGLHFETARALRGLVAAQEALGDIPAAYALHKRLLTVELALREATVDRENEVIAARLELAWAGIDSATTRLGSIQLARQNSQLEAERRSFEHLAHTDPLTGLANRRHFDAQLSRLVVRAGLSRRPLGLVLLDIDRFKEINDRLSHVIGDTLLTRVADVVARHCRLGDVAARVGGEEFALVLPGAQLAAVRAVAERVRVAVADIACGDLDEGLRVTVSAGVAALRPGQTASAMFNAADMALYAAKREGRNSVQVAASIG